MENRTTIQLSDGLRKELRILASKRDISYQELLKDMVDVFKELDRKKTLVSIPSKLSEKINKKIEDTNMSSISEYITFLLRVILSEKESFKYSDENKIKEKYNKEALVKLSNALKENTAALKFRMDAIGEISTSIKDAMVHAESDGTYEARGSGSGIRRW